MRVLVLWGSKRGGTAGIAMAIADTLRGRGIDAVTAPAADAPSPVVFDALIIGGAVYANRWHRDARRYLERHARELARVPTWAFSSGPLDASAATEELAPPRPLGALLARIGALGHVTFGGRLEPTATGFPAAAMAKDHAGDWRDWAQIEAWAISIAEALPTARPHATSTPAGRSLARLVEYGAVAWALPAAVLVIAIALAPRWLALLGHGVAMSAWFASLAVRYQRADGARAPVVTALGWIAMTVVIELALVAPLVAPRIALATSVVGWWLPLAFAFAAAWGAGEIGAMLPIPHPPQRLQRGAA